MAHALGLTMSQWDALDDIDRAYAMAEHVAQVEDEARKCPACGGDPGECQDPDNQHAYVVSTRRCYRTRALAEAQKKRTQDNEGVLWSVALDPTRKKSAMKKEARRG